MKKIFPFLLMLIFALPTTSQNLTTNVDLSRLPRTSDDFQNYQFDYALENIKDVEYAAPFYIHSMCSEFDGVLIHPFEHNCPVKEIACELYNNDNDKEFIVYSCESKYVSSGQIVDFNGKIAVINDYAFGYHRWSDIEGEKLHLLPCTANPYIFDIQPTRNTKGLITNIGNDIYYTYDDQDRVVEIKVGDGNYSYRYSYFSNSNRIENIFVFISGRKRGEVKYTYSDGRVANVNAKEFYASGNNDAVEKEYIKSYKYDSHNRISEIDLTVKKIGDSEMQTTYQFNNVYDSGGKQITSEISKMFKSRTGTYTNGTYKVPKRFTRKYYYDEKDNWIKIEDDKGNFVKRTIEYRASATNGEVDIYRLYDEDEVSVNATFGHSLSWYAKQDSYFLNFYPVILEENGIIDASIINVDFIVERDGTISNLKASSGSSDVGNRNAMIKTATALINGLTWIPASINGTSVRSNVSLAWHIHRNNGDLEVVVIKDVQWTTKEKEAYDKAKDMIRKRQDAKYVDDLKRQANSGMSQSSFQAKIKLAKMYLEGDRVEMNLSEALNLYLDLAINDNWKDAKDVLCYYRREILSNKTYVQKLAKAKVASNLTQPDGWDLLCMDAAALTGDKELVLKQLAISKEYNNGLYFHWLEPAAILFNDSQAMYELSELLLDNTSKLFDSKKGIELLKKAADMGNPDARHSLGLKYKYGLYVEKDKKKAKEYLK